MSRIQHSLYKDKRIHCSEVLMIVYTHYMAKTSPKRSSTTTKKVDPRIKYAAIPVLALIAVGAIVIAIMVIMNMPKPEGAQRGVGANGFRAYEEKDGDLGIGKVVSRDEVADALGAKARSVDDVDVSSVFNINGTRGQTATFPITKANGKPASVYVDVMVFKNSVALDEANIYSYTAKTDPINTHPTYYMHALTLGSDREYRLMVVNGIKVYKFVLTQPYRDITINEAMAVATLKKIAAKSDL